MSHVVVLSTTLKPRADGFGIYPLAGLNGGVPVLWNLFFAVEDLATRPELGAERRDEVVPLCSKVVALDRLAQRAPWLCDVFQSRALADYATLLSESIREGPGEYLLMDLSQLATRDDPGELYRNYAALLRRIEHDSSRAVVDSELRVELVAMSGDDPSLPLPDAHLLLDYEYPPWEATERHARIIGASWTGSLAWERRRA